MQLIVTHLVVQRIGIWGAILFLPVGLGMASFGVLFAPTLATTTVALGSNSVFRYSINRAGLELLFMPLSLELRKKIKLFIDVFVDRFGRAAAAFIILLFTSKYFPLGLPGTAAATIALTCVCVVLALQLRRTYTNAFRQQLARREVDLTEINRFVTDPASVRLLVGALESAQERQILLLSATVAVGARVRLLSSTAAASRAHLSICPRGSAAHAIRAAGGLRIGSGDHALRCIRGSATGGG